MRQHRSWSLTYLPTRLERFAVIWMWDELQGGEEEGEGPCDEVEEEEEEEELHHHLLWEIA